MSSKALLVALLMAAPVLGAQREYIVSSTINVTSGVDTRPQTQIPLASRPPVAITYGVFPTLSLNSQNTRSSLGLSYGYGFNRFQFETPISNQSHSASGAFTTQMGRNWSISLTDSFERTEDASTYNAFRSVSTATTDTPLFYPVAARVASRNNQAGLNLSRSLGLRNSLVLNGSYSIRDYLGSSASTAGGLSNQDGATAGVTFRRQLGMSDTIEFGVSSSYSQFDQFEDSRTGSVRTTYSATLGRSWRVVLGGGASVVKSVGAFGDYFGVDASASLGKTLEAGTFFVRYNRDTGQQGGLGSTSNTQRFAVTWSQNLSRTSTLFIDGNVFDTKGILDNFLNSRGYSVSANVGYNLSAKLSLHFGGQIQEYLEPAEFAFDQQRLFLSLRYTEPRLFGFLK